MSWSAISTFKWRKGDWYEKYVVHGKCTRGEIIMCVVAGWADPDCPVVRSSPELRFGSYVDKRIQTDPGFLPELVRYPIMQHEMRCTFNGIPLVGFSDAALDIKKKSAEYFLRDYKTGRNPWDQKRADETGQLTMYAFMIYLELKLKPEQGKFFIDWMPTHMEDGEVAFIEEGKIVTFETRRSMQQVLEFGQEILATWKAMELYAAQHNYPKIEKPVSRFLS